MNHQQAAPITRRRALLALGQGGGVLGFCTATASWVTAAHAQTLSADQYHGLPLLDGSVQLDDATLTQYANDFGCIVHERPLAVLKPGSVRDISRMLVFARRHGIRVVGRGRGHTVFGQAQLQGGIVIDLSTLNAVHHLGAEQVEVDAGMRWTTLLAATLARGLMPPALTDFIGQTVGGTLSVGGVGGMTHRHGAQVDNVLALEVVTGDGKRIACSPTQRRDLFDAVLAGQGQVGVIVRATLKLVPAPARIRVVNLVYGSVAAVTAEMQRLMAEQHFDFLEAFGVRQASGAWLYLLQAGRFYSPPAAPDDNALLAGLTDVRAQRSVDDSEFAAFANRVHDLPAQPHPWIDLILPNPSVVAFASMVERTLEPLTDGDRFSILLIPMQTRHFTRPLFRAPLTQTAFGFGILRSLPPDAAAVTQALAYNRTLFDHCRDVGGTHYPISAVHLSRTDWVRHYGARLAGLEAAKRRYDAGNVLAGGPNLF